MAKRLDVSKILRNNPQVDRKLLTDSAKLVRELGKLGMPGHATQKLASPFQRKRATITRASLIQL